MNLLDFDTIIFDLDDTIWHGNKQGIWAKSIQSPFNKIGNTIYGSCKNFLSIEDDLLITLEKLKDRNLGFLTKGGLLNTQWEKQPPIYCLKIFNIYQYFKYDSYVLYKDDLKSRVFKPSGKTLYIDDDETQLWDINFYFPEVTVLNRNSFNKWTDLIK